MKENKCTCGGQLDYEDSEWLGEDKNGIGHIRIIEVCLRCGKRTVEISRE